MRVHMLCYAMHVRVHHTPSATHPAPPFKVFRWLRTSGLAPCHDVGTVFADPGVVNENTIIQLGGPLLLLPLPPPWRLRIPCAYWEDVSARVCGAGSRGGWCAQQTGCLKCSPEGPECESGVTMVSQMATSIQAWPQAADSSAVDTRATE